MTQRASGCDQCMGSVGVVTRGWSVGGGLFDLSHNEVSYALLLSMYSWKRYSYFLLNFCNYLPFNI